MPGAVCVSLAGVCLVGQPVLGLGQVSSAGLQAILLMMVSHGDVWFVLCCRVL